MTLAGAIHHALRPPVQTRVGVVQSVSGRTVSMIFADGVTVVPGIAWLGTPSWQRPPAVGERCVVRVQGAGLRVVMGLRPGFRAMAQMVGSAWNGNGVGGVQLYSPPLPKLTTWTVDCWIDAVAAAWADGGMLGFGPFGSVTGTDYDTQFGAPGSYMIGTGFAGNDGSGSSLWVGGVRIANSGAQFGGLHHWELGYDGTTLYWFVDGVLQLTAVPAGGAVVESAAGISGPLVNGVATLKVDEFRVSNICRHTAGFAVPTGPYATDAATVLLWHFDELPLATVLTQPFSATGAAWITLQEAALDAMGAYPAAFAVGQPPVVSGFGQWAATYTWGGVVSELG